MTRSPASPPSGAPVRGRPTVPPPVLDDIDRRIVAALVDDGRLSVNELAYRVGVSRATAYSRLDRLPGGGRHHRVHRHRRPRQAGPRGRGAHPGQRRAERVAGRPRRAAAPARRRVPGVHQRGLRHGGAGAGASIEALRDVVLDHLHGATHVRSTQTVFVLDEQRRRSRCLIAGSVPPKFWVQVHVAACSPTPIVVKSQLRMFWRWPARSSSRRRARPAHPAGPGRCSRPPGWRSRRPGRGRRTCGRRATCARSSPGPPCRRCGPAPPRSSWASA